MGYYINPPGMTKEKWLDEHAIAISYEAPQFQNIPPDCFAVCLVHNGLFTAAGIAVDERELQAFNEKSDPRPKVWLIVRKTDLLEVEPSIKEFC